MLKTSVARDTTPGSGTRPLPGYRSPQAISSARTDQTPRTLSLLANVDLLHLRDALPSSLSGGEQQRVAIARAMINAPFILLADEPTANLDRESADGVLALFSEMNVRGTAVLMATHDHSIVERHPRRSIRLEDGRLVNVEGV